jgi:uncharacterized protein (DUF302 family)
MPIVPDRALIELTSPLNFAATIERLTHAIETAGMTMFARIDHAGAAQNIGLVMPPTVVLIYGNAKAGTPIMIAAPTAALELPLRVLVRENLSATTVSFHPIAPQLRNAGVPENLANRLDPGQRLIVDALD